MSEEMLKASASKHTGLNGKFWSTLNDSGPGKRRRSAPKYKFDDFVDADEPMEPEARPSWKERKRVKFNSSAHWMTSLAETTETALSDTTSTASSEGSTSSTETASPVASETATAPHDQVAESFPARDDENSKSFDSETSRAPKPVATSTPSAGLWPAGFPLFTDADIPLGSPTRTPWSEQSSVLEQPQLSRDTSGSCSPLPSVSSTFAASSSAVQAASTPDSEEPPTPGRRRRSPVQTLPEPSSELTDNWLTSLAAGNGDDANAAAKNPVAPASSSSSLSWSPCNPVIVPSSTSGPRTSADVSMFKVPVLPVKTSSLKRPTRPALVAPAGTTATRSESKAMLADSTSSSSVNGDCDDPGLIYARYLDNKWKAKGTFQIARAFENDNLLINYIKIHPGKIFAHVLREFAAFTVLAGTVSVKTPNNDDSFVAKRFDMFSVAVGDTFSITNLGLDYAVIFVAQFLQP